MKHLEADVVVGGGMSGLCAANDLDPIPGLYACSTDTATVFADSYCFYHPGSTMSYAINSGCIAGMESVAYMDSDKILDPEA